MSLALTLTIGKNFPSGRDNRYVFDGYGGSIGRSQDNDFVLPDPNHYLSRKHARISFENGAYYLTDTSENGVFLNRADLPVGKNNTVALNDGDSLGIGEYEFQVNITESGRTQIPDWNETDSDLADTGPIPSRSPWQAAESDQNAPDILDGSDQPEEVPDYPYEDSQVLRAREDMRSVAESNHSGAEHDFFKSPPMQEEGQALNWDKTSVAASPHTESQKPDWDKTDFVAPVRPKEDMPDDSENDDHTAVHAAPRSHQRVTPESVAEDVQMADYPSHERPHAARDQRREPVSAGERVGSAPSPHEAKALQAFLQGAGVKVDPLSPEASEALMRLQGRLYREIVQGMMEVLKARFKVKDMIRAHQTQVQIRENNPLKFIGNVDDALEYLLTKPSSGFLDPEAAFQEAFQDIKDHQIAMVVGMRAAFESLLRRFDPEQLERKFSSGSKIGDYLPMYKKSLYWERLQQWYENDIKAAAEDDFQGLFGKEFTRAYEDQMAKLALLRRK